MRPCEYCGAEPPKIASGPWAGSQGMHDYCAHCSKDLCVECFKRRCRQNPEPDGHHEPDTDDLGEQS